MPSGLLHKFNSALCFYSATTIHSEKKIQKVTSIKPMTFLFCSSKIIFVFKLILVKNIIVYFFYSCALKIFIFDHCVTAYSAKYHQR